MIPIIKPKKQEKSNKALVLFNEHLEETRREEIKKAYEEVKFLCFKKELSPEKDCFVINRNFELNEQKEAARLFGKGTEDILILNGEEKQTVPFGQFVL